MTFDGLDPDRGSEEGIGWHWLTQIASRVDGVVAIVPEECIALLKGDHRLPGNVEMVCPDVVPATATRLPLPPWYRRYIDFHTAAGVMCASLSADLAHQVNFGTPYWGSAIAGFKGPRLLGPVGVSSPAPALIAASVGVRHWRAEAVRQLVMVLPVPPVTWREAMQAADHVLTVDTRSGRMADQIGWSHSPMLADGADPVPVDQLVPFDGRRDFVWAGRLMPRKGAVLAVRAFAAALPRLPGDVRFVLFGDGPTRKAVEAAVADTGVGNRIDLAGHSSRNETVAAMAGAKALVFSSVRDTFGGVVLEAAERATPSVFALHRGVAGLREWWPGNAGWFASSRTPRQMVAVLADGMVAAATAPEFDWQLRADAAYRFALTHDWNRRGAAMIGCYRGLLAQESRSYAADAARCL